MDETDLSPKVEEKNDIEIELLRNEIQGLLALIQNLSNRIDLLGVRNGKP